MPLLIGLMMLIFGVIANLCFLFLSTPCIVKIIQILIVFWGFLGSILFFNFKLVYTFVACLEMTFWSQLVIKNMDALHRWETYSYTVSYCTMYILTFMLIISSFYQWLVRSLHLCVHYL